MRNSHLLSIAPNGNTSIVANIVTGGLEPVFLFEYIRTATIPQAPTGLDLPKKIDWNTGKHESINKWNLVKEGDEHILKIVYEGITYKYDQNRGLTKETMCNEYSVNYLKSLGEWDSKADYAVTTEKLSEDEHINTMKIFAKFIDTSISKTINLINEYPYESFKKIYEKLYDTGYIKGGTTYRAGTMASVMAKKDNTKTIDGIHKNEAPIRPRVMNCDIHRIRAKGHDWIIIVGLLGNDPYEVFAFKKKALILPEKCKNGTLTKVKRGIYNLTTTDGLILEDIKEFFEKDEEEALTRMISTSLRHGAHIKFIVEQLNKAEGDISSFSKAISRALKKYIVDGDKPSDTNCPNCGVDDGLVYQEGCLCCKHCGYSKCG